MQETQFIGMKNRYVWIVVGVVVLTALFFLLDKNNSSKNTNSDDKTKVENVISEVASSTSKNQVDTVVSTNKGYKIEQLPVDSQSKPSISVPDLNRKLVQYPGYVVAPEAIADAQIKVEKIQTELKKDNMNWSNWINLGIYQKSGGDLNGALISWNYASKISPSDYVSNANIGNLYAYYLMDNGMAETYYKKAITNGPKQSYLYIQFAEVYKDVFKDLDKAKTIINDGLNAIPNDPSLLQFQELYLK